jgi:hypothetical protein
MTDRAVRCDKTSAASASSQDRRDGLDARGATRPRPHQARHAIALMFRTAAARQDPDRIRLVTRSPSCSGRPRRDKTPTASGSSHDRPHVQDGAARQDTARIRLHTRWRSCAEQCGATRRRPHQVPHTIVVTDSTTRWPMTSAASHSPHLLVHRGLDVERQEHQQPPVRPEIAGGT